MKWRVLYPTNDCRREHKDFEDKKALSDFILQLINEERWIEIQPMPTIEDLL